MMAAIVREWRWVRSIVYFARDGAGGEMSTWRGANRVVERGAKDAG